MGLKKEVPDWKNAGIEPSENLKSEGHKAGVKPPASLFNWFWFSVSEFLSEIKERVYTKDETYTKEEVDVSIAKKADKNLFENHTSNKNNPHSVDKIQVGLSNVDNSKQATKIEFDSHVASKTNPHSVTKVQVGLSNVDNIQQATKAEFNSHNTDTTKHITDTERINWNSKATGDHSHNFSEIKNVPSASSSISGITRLVDSVVSSDISSAATPKSVKSAYDAAKYSEAQLNTHSLDKDNPHSVTKAQVGMSNVDNVQQATKVEFTAHISNVSNPHSVTKAQVGLSNVDNSQQATKVEFNSHAMDTTKHITAAERNSWNSKQPAVTDTGWVNLVMQNGYTALTANPLKIRKIGNIVHLCGMINAPGSTNGKTIALIPAMFRPSQDENIDATLAYNNAGTQNASFVTGPSRDLTCVYSTMTSNTVAFNGTWFVG
ncbi:MAG: tail fiber protein [Vagococcus sp.]|uniref:tail fiber protein n=1 Tax=Vagococcus sp. TaxID=1933889 RepID=UPI002FC8DA96